jgi:hypothetical protein
MLINRIIGSAIAFIGASAFFYLGLETEAASCGWWCGFVASFILFFVATLVMVVD